MVEPDLAASDALATVLATVSDGAAVFSAGNRPRPLSPLGGAVRSDAVAAREDREAKARRRVARALVASYHEAELAGLVEHVAEAIERYRAGELDVHDVDELIHR
jgi:hypothetical protein